MADVLDLVVELADVTRVHAHGTAAGLNRLEDVLRLEVDVGDNGDTRLLGDDRQRLRIFIRRAGDSNVSQPAAVSSAICCSVAPMLCVFVVVIDWTDTGAPPPDGNVSHHQLMRRLARKRRRGN